MSTSIPQYSDVEIIFEDLAYNVDPSDINLSDLDDIILVISRWSTTGTVVVRLLNSVNPERFDINNSNKSITVNILASELTQECGKYCANLWLSNADTYLTHVTKTFTVIPVVGYSS